ncbi:hypothetical protein FSP39_017810 [Pinctada imbricata]|uniref:Uncharacterized protein n=1 Tax=Pinctada imbricata TaxID=66713 RepID=A0AA88YIR7_PINIB|nr:hypothetical protein FSP39_017810 [Pinctada imbricata]
MNESCLRMCTNAPSAQFLGECENGTYSYDCKSACGMCRNNATCDKETGVCPGHLCDEGYFGAYCIEALLDVLGNPREYTARLGMFFACFVSFLTAAVTSGRQNDQKRKTLLRVHKAAKMRGLKTTLFKDRLYINGKLYRCDINRCSFTGHGFSSTFSARHTPSICWDLPVDSFSHISQIDADDLRIPEDTDFPDTFLSSYDVTSSVDDAFWSAMDQ